MSVKLATLISRNKNEDSSIKTVSVIITPETAPEFIGEYNDENRPLTKSLCKLYANEFLRGEWHETGENIIYGVIDTPNGEIEKLISGQHRLFGLILAQEMYDADPSYWKDAVLELRTEITTGVNMDSADHVDKGKTRSHTDVLYRSPVVDAIIPDEWNESQAKRKKWCNTLSTAARLVWQREGGKAVSSAEKFVHSEMLNFIGPDRHPELHRYVTMVLDADRDDEGNKGLKASLAYLAGFSYLACLDADGKICEDATEKVEDLLNTVAIGTGYEKGSAGHALVGYWNSLEPGSKDRDLDVSGPLVKCFNALLADEKGLTARKLKLTKREREDYRICPPLLAGWDEASYEAIATQKALDAEAEQEALTEDDTDATELAEAQAELDALAAIEADAA